MTNARIYIASLSDYNAGRLLGRWIALGRGEEHVQREIAEMLSESREPHAEEWAIHDYEGFANLHLDEFTDIATVVEVANRIEEHGPVFAELVNYCGGTNNLEEATRYMENAYRGAFDSLRDYAEDLTSDCYSDALSALPDFIRYHIDFQGIADDMVCGGDIFVLEIDHKTHVFDSQC